MIVMKISTQERQNMLLEQQILKNGDAFKRRKLYKYCIKYSKEI